jgi:hypothetical protein
MFETGKFLWKNFHRAGKLEVPLCLFCTYLPVLYLTAPGAAT